MNHLLMLVFFVLFFKHDYSQNLSKNDSGLNYEKQVAEAKSLRKAGKFDEAINIHYTILKFLQNHNTGTKEYFIKLTKNYQSLANIYLFLNDTLSINYADKAISIAEKTSDFTLIERSYNLKYYCLYEVSGKANELNSIADKCIKYSKLTGSKEMLGEAYMHKCNALIELGKVEDADVYCQKAETIFSGLDNGIFLSSVLGNIGNIFVKSKQPKKALKYHLKAYAISKKLNNNESLVNDTRNLADDYYNAGDYKKSARFYKIYSDDLASYYKNLLDKKFTEAEAKFNTEQKDKRIVLQELKIAKQKKTGDRVIFAGLLVLLIAVGFYQWYLFKNRKNKELAEQKLIKEKELNSLRKRFLENIAHEIRTPITLVKGYLSLALENINDKKALQKQINIAISNSEKVLTNANEIFKLLTPEIGNAAVRKSEIQLNKFLKKVFYSFESLAVLKKIELEYHSNIAQRLAITSYKTRLEKILNNFIANAIKFSSGNSKIIFKAVLNRTELTVKLTDFGPGISKQEQSKIFDRFYQSANTSNAGGMGIGLALARDLAQSLGGTVSVESEQGKGATFILRMPVESYVSLPKNKMISPLKYEGLIPKIEINPDDKPKILIVEDNPEMNAYLKSILCKQYNCDVAFDGIEGLQKIQTRKFSLIISDIMMPQLDGIELKQRINSLPNYKIIPFVFITARSQLENKVESYRLGIDDYITKPFEKEELIARIEKLLANGKARNNWAKNHPDLVGNDKNHEEQLLEKIKVVIRKRLSDEQFKVFYLAEEVAYSRRQLSRLVKQYTGLSPLQLIVEMRMQKAYFYLSEKKFATVKEVRIAVGMPATTNFNKKFKERFGVMPTEILKRKY